MATIKDVAELAGVSIATVSCAISGTKKVSLEAQRRIRDAIEELNYIPNSTARGLKTMKGTEIGIVLNDIDDSYHADILKGVSSYVQRMGYEINIAFSENNPNQECEKIDRMISRNVSGLIIVTCQPDNSEYFRGRIIKNNIPTVFVERKPSDMEVNYAGFDNFSTIFKLTNRLIELGYKSLSLVLGPRNLSSEQDAYNGFMKALKQYGLKCNPLHICNTTMTKEHTFKITMAAYEHDFPQAIITTSTTIAKGVQETAYIYHKKIPKDIALITLGEECWTQADALSGIIHTSRSAITLGRKVTELLLSNIQSPLLFEKRQLIMDDVVALKNLVGPSEQKRISTTYHPTSSSSIDILTNDDLNTSDALKLLTRDFVNESGINVNVEAKPHRYILDQILKDNDAKALSYDMYLYDIPWLAYLAENRLIMDITEYVDKSPFNKDAFFSGSVQNFTYKGRYYGIPIVGGSQLLFYRKDFFCDKLLNRAFEQKYKIALRPPRTWAEFNGMCTFFTQKFNSDSPTNFGTSITAKHHEELICNIMPYIWAHGGKLFDSNNQPCINSHQNQKAYKTLFETLQYTDGDYLNTTYKSAVVDFADGKTAMVIIFSEMLSTLNQIITPEFEHKIGYAVIPGRSAVWPGWNFGVSNFTKKYHEIMHFINWLSKKGTSYYLTILDGQTTMIEPYENNELRRLHPWLKFLADNEKFCHPRRPPVVDERTRCIPQNAIEKVATNVFYDIIQSQHNITIENALDSAQDELCHIFKSYGYNLK